MMSRAGVMTSQYQSPLAGLKFDGETTRQMGIAFEMALASLGATRRRNDPIRTALAQRIFPLAKSQRALSRAAL